VAGSREAQDFGQALGGFTRTEEGGFASCLGKTALPLRGRGNSTVNVDGRHACWWKGSPPAPIEKTANITWGGAWGFKGRGILVAVPGLLY